MSRHQTVRVSVKAFVDEGIAPLVVALDALDDNLLAVDSCQNTGGVAYVMFLANGADWTVIRRIRECLADFAPWPLGLRLVGGDLYEVRCRPESVALVAEALAA